MTAYSEKVYEKSFSDDVSKDAYLKACKWLAKNIYSKKSSKYITVKISKKEPEDKKEKPTFIVELFVTINEKEVKESVCDKCKQLHTMFYCIDKPKCEECKITVYKHELERQTMGIKKYFEEEFEWLD